MAALTATTAGSGQLHPSGMGRLYFGDHLAESWISVPFRQQHAMLFGAVGACAHHHSVILVTVKAQRTVGDVRLDRVGVDQRKRAADAEPKPIGAWPAPMPAGYRTAEGFTVELCSEGSSLPGTAQFAFQVTRTGSSGGGIVGLRFTYQDEQGSRHTTTIPYSMAICGRDNSEVRKYRLCTYP